MIDEAKPKYNKHAKTPNTPKFTFKELQMLFHTSFRNVGLFTSISLAMLGYSRYYRGKNGLYNIAFILISLGFLSIATYMAYVLVRNQKTLMQNKNFTPHRENILNTLNTIATSVFYLNIIVILFTAYTLYRELKHSKYI